jgi:hypothetical protein
MKLINDIVNELVDSEKSISSPLLKTKVLATRIKNTHLLDWVNSELNGYDNAEEIPDYRTFTCSLSGSYINGYYRFSDQAFPTAGLPESIIDSYREMSFAQSISALESLKNKDGGTLQASLSAEMIGMLERSIKKMGNPYMQILSAHKTVSDNVLTQIISVVRSKLLDFMLKIEEEFGTVTDIQELKNNNSRITSIMHQTIVTNGSGNVLNTGDSAKVRADISINTSDKASLKKSLSDNGISDEDTAELMAVVDIELPNKENGRFGTQVNHWISKMMTKALDGSWQIGIGAAGGMLAESLQHYYGLK